MTAFLRIFGVVAFFLREVFTEKLQPNRSVVMS